MHYQSFLSAVALVAVASALPLNINLGAYSPALVVGDGAISFEEGQGVENLVNSLQGAAVNTAAARAGGAGRATPPQEVVTDGLAQAQVATSESTPILTE